jgi:membrane protease YdiL (CAAX protease family)
VAFALAHGYAWGFPQFFVLSLTFVALFERTGTLAAPIAAHGAFNTLSLILLLWGTSQAAPAGT